MAKNPAAVALGKLGAAKSPRTSLLPPAARKAIARRAALKRWENKKPTDAKPATPTP